MTTIVGADKNEIKKPNNKLVAQSFNFYSKAFGDLANGLQLEGLNEEDFAKVVDDNRSTLVEVGSGESKYVLPIFTPVENISWYNNPFFEKNIGKFGPVFHYCANPELLGLIDENGVTEITDFLQKVSEINGTIVFDHQLGVDNVPESLQALLKDSLIDFEEVFLGDTEGQFSSQIHFKAASARTEKPINFVSKSKTYEETFAELDSAQEYSEKGLTVVSGPRLSDEMLNYLWGLYKEPFANLIEDDPLRTALKREEFDEMLKDPASLSIVYQEAGKPITLLHMVSDINICTWLNTDAVKERYKEEYERGELWYFPGIVTDINARGAMNSGLVINLLTEIAAARQMEPAIIFECSDLSAQYIPKIVTRAIEQTGYYTMDTSEQGRYVYRAFKL